MTITHIARWRLVQGVPPIDSLPAPHIPMSRLATQDGHALASLMRLREEAAAQVDRLLAFLDATEGDIDLEGESEDEGGQCDDEGDMGDSGIADLDGLMEQAPSMFAGHDQQVLA